MRPSRGGYMDEEAAERGLGRRSIDVTRMRVSVSRIADLDYGQGFRVQDSGFRVQDSRPGLLTRVQDSGFRVSDLDYGPGCMSVALLVIHASALIACF